MSKIHVEDNYAPGVIYDTIPLHVRHAWRVRNWKGDGREPPARRPTPSRHIEGPPPRMSNSPVRDRGMVHSRRSRSCLHLPPRLTAGGILSRNETQGTPMAWAARSPRALARNESLKTDSDGGKVSLNDGGLSLNGGRLSLLVEARRCR
uniref:MC30 n=1 Tax=Micrococcus sp. 28 TaxID=161213 RepID=Q8VPP3_9MICC|nr:MC30 [Micrococcus sp. 28]